MGKRRPEQSKLVQTKSVEWKIEPKEGRGPPSGALPTPTTGGSNGFCKILRMAEVGWPLARNDRVTHRPGATPCPLAFMLFANALECLND